MPKASGASEGEPGRKAEKTMQAAKPEKALNTTESTMYLEGLFSEFRSQVERYHSLTAHMRELEARVELNEKTLSLTRDHLADAIESTEFAAPRDWTRVLHGVRYVGVRLVDACIDLLRQHGRMTAEELVDALNHGMFRFRTNSPAREIHAALLRQKTIRKNEDGWEWIGPKATVPQGLKLLRTGTAE